MFSEGLVEILGNANVLKHALQFASIFKATRLNRRGEIN